MDKSFPALLNRRKEDGANTKISASFEAEDIGYEGKDILDYVKEQQKLGREERAEDTRSYKQKIKKRAIEIHMTEMQVQAEAEAEEKKRIQIAQIEAAKQQAKIEADKELKIKEMELQAQQAQATARPATTPPPRNKDAKSPKLPSLID